MRPVLLSDTVYINAYIINASSTSSSLQVPSPSHVIFCFLFSLFARELFGRGWPLATSCWITCITSWWSWAALQLAFMNLWTVKMSTISWWTAVNDHKYTFVIYQSGIWLAPSAGVVCSGLRCREHYLFFVLKGLLGFLYQAATRQSLPICYWGYSRFNLSLGLYSSSLWIASSRSPLRTYLTWISLYVVTSTLPQLVKL